MPSIDVTVNHVSGLHARPAAIFVRTASAYPCTVTVSNLTAHGPAVNAKSILKVLTLGVNQGCTIRIESEGEKAEEALHDLNRLVSTNFGESA
jgi:phosphotransferase system HPr (HPr) family protein